MNTEQKVSEIMEIFDQAAEELQRDLYMLLQGYKFRKELERQQ